MKNALIILLFIPISCVSQNDSLEKKNNPDALDKITVIKSSLSRSLYQSTFESYFTSLADSINNAFTVDDLPLFLKDSNFDYSNSFFWLQGDNTISLRDVIFSRINSCFSLQLIASEKTGIYKKKPSRGNSIKFYGLSFYDLALQRMIKLACKK